ncbi:exodeoxyribonuclease I [Methylocucumis oryzae]|uniref:exodeoxyribonuclease I n=1 Tax=Methylocucumis oryzae TaxID=1632867 RepID=UPI000AD20845
MSSATFYWHDYEAFGIDPARTRPAQFAGIRTDDQFNVIEEPHIYYCRLPLDSLPNPDACLITGITPQETDAKGVCEAEFIKLIHQHLAQPNTCTLGYNNIRYDDELTRHCLYRNFFDPYAREWQNGNSRWDLLDVVRAVKALRPDNIKWPSTEEQKPSFKLTDLTHANAITHDNAHDALSDVYATIALAQLIKQQQPKIFAYLLAHRTKAEALKLLNLGSYEPVIHVSGKYRSDQNCLAIVLPICQHPVNNNGIVVYDLSVSPEQLLNLSVEEIRQRVFTAVADLPEDCARVPLKVVHVNKCPVLAPMNALRAIDITRLGLNIELCTKHQQLLKSASPSLEQKCASVFAGADEFPKYNDPDLMLYSGGFFFCRRQAKNSDYKTG